eukprot:1328201-Amphidinium_carterae.1
MTNSGHVAEQVGKLCDESHRHILLLGGKAKAAERYPPRLIAAILKGIRSELRSGGILGALEAGTCLEEREALEEYAEFLPQEVFDDISGAKLEPKLVAKARRDEMEYMRSLAVYEEVDGQVAVDGGHALINTRWIDVNKGDSTTPNYRSRLVVQETRRVTSLQDGFETFAATPPIEALRLLLSSVVSGPVDTDVVVLFIDISRAHLHSDIQREVYVRPPPESGLPAGRCWKLLKAMYGLKDAGACFEKKAEGVLVNMGFRVGSFSPCLYYNADAKVAVFRHGDDFVVRASRHEADKFHEELNRHLIAKKRGQLGLCPDKGDL